MFLLTTETLDPTLRRLLVEDSQPNFFVLLDEYLESFLQFLISSIFAVFYMVVAVWLISRLIKYWHSDPIRSHEVQRWLQVESDDRIRTVQSKVNWIVKGSTVRFVKNQVIIRIPTKGWWQGTEHIDCQREVRRRLDSPEFRELLSIHYSGYRFGDIIVNRNCYIVKGEAY